MTDTTPPSLRRRRFLAATVSGIHGIISATLTFFLGGAVVGPSFVGRREAWLGAGLLSNLPDDEPTPVTIRISRHDGYAQTVERQVVFLVKSGESVKALSSTCTHLGCPIKR